MNKAEVVVNTVAAAGIVFGAGMLVSGESPKETREAYVEVVDDRAAEIQQYREEHPSEGTVSGAIEDAYAPKLEDASDRMDEARETFNIGGLSLAGGFALGAVSVGNAAFRRYRRLNTNYGKLVDEHVQNVADYNNLLDHYNNRRMGHERLSALAAVLDVGLAVHNQNGVSNETIFGLTDRVLLNLDRRYDGQPLHEDSHNEWGSVVSPAPVDGAAPAGHGGAQFDVIDSSVKRAPSPADGDAIPNFQPVEAPAPISDTVNPAFVVERQQQGPEAEFTVAGEDPTFVVNSEQTTSTWQSRAERPVVEYPAGPAAAEPAPVVEAAPAQQPAQWPVAPAYPQQPVAPQSSRKPKPAPARKRRKPEQGF